MQVHCLPDADVLSTSYRCTVYQMQACCLPAADVLSTICSWRLEARQSPQRLENAQEADPHRVKLQEED